MAENRLLLDLFPWAPRPLIVLALFAAAVTVAVAVHSLVWAVFKRFFSARYPLLHDIGRRTHGITRFAVIMVSLGIAVPVAPLHPTVAEGANRALLAAFIVFLGWLAIVAANFLMDRYIDRFKLDVTDNLLARKAVTQVRLLKRAIGVVIVIVTASLALMSFDSVREFGVSLFASAGIAGIAVGLAARPLLENLFAGIQLAITQPIRLDDALIVEGEFGKVEEITSTYVVLKLWDWRRMIVPLSYFFDKPFQNWTRSSASLIGTVLVYVDYTAPVDQIRQKLTEIVKQSKLWDGQVVNLQVNNVTESVIELRALVSARNSGSVADLRAEVREKLVAYLQQELPWALPTSRQRSIAVEDPRPRRRVASA
ncbi:MAG: mechanosensitive ion channel [Alphaproteobacteria bacterium]|nr:mechanosensitive ion channel [Alphaproteobacteria bacterium]